MPWFDVTRTLSPDTPVFPGDPPVRFREIVSGGFRVTDVRLGTHAGTHIDAPRHLPDGVRGIDEVPLQNLLGTCSVVDCTECAGPIGRDILKEHVAAAPRILLKTTCSDALHPPRAFIDAPGAEYLIRNHVRCVGTDALSIERLDGGGDVHRRLLQGGVPVIELLDLSAIEAGTYWMAALPLRLRGRDGSPARVILSDRQPDDMP